MQRSILIADDDRNLVRALTLRCQRLGFRVYEAYDSITALRLTHTHHPDVVCLDVGLPGGNGLGLCEMLCTDDRTAHIRKIILTGRTDQESIRRCHELCAYYVQKSPDVWDRVAPLLREQLEKRPAFVGLLG